MKVIPLTNITMGINRLRTKGAPAPGSLYDLLNGRVTDSDTVKSRPGTFREAALDSNTKGLVAYKGKFHVFGTSVVSVPANFVLHVLTSPNSTPLETIALTRIHFAVPYLGFLYVVAEFADGGISHFWLSSSGSWNASTEYDLGDIVEPTTPNGLAYKATRNGSAYPSWQANVPRSVGNIIEPTTFNNFYYEVVSVTGSSPQSGDTEPVWPTSDGAQISEDVNGYEDTTPTSTTPQSVDVPSSVRERYG